VSIPELCLDPYYRTLFGFQVLIEKDWLSFGHKFNDRCGHLSVSRDNNEADVNSNAASATYTTVQNHLKEQGHLRETSPVFHQFLECVRHIMFQFPGHFEFNEHFLCTLHFHVNACHFGTFLGNSEKERLALGVRTKTHSFWDYVDDNKDEFLNPNYDESLNFKDNKGVIMFTSDVMRFWGGIFGLNDYEVVSLEGQSNNEKTSTSSLQDGPSGHILGMDIESKVRDGSTLFKSFFDRTTASIRNWTGPQAGSGGAHMFSSSNSAALDEGEELQPSTGWQHFDSKNGR
jgi:hypothetical protein